MELLRRDYALPQRADLADDKAFLIGLPNAAQEGVLLKPLGYHLFRYTREDLKADWINTAVNVDASDVAIETEGTQRTSLAEQLQDVLVKGLEVADKVTVSLTEEEVRVRLHNTAYSSTVSIANGRGPAGLRADRLPALQPDRVHIHRIR